MASQSTSRDSILFQNSARDAILVDIPRSISLAQGTALHPCTAKVPSTQALEAPFPSTEPRSKPAKDRILRLNPNEYANRYFPESLLRQALQEISEVNGGVWCLERDVSVPSEKRQGKKRTWEGKIAQGRDSGHNSMAYKEASILSLGSFLTPIDLSTTDRVPTCAACLEIGQIANKLIHNSQPYPLSLSHPKTYAQDSNLYMIPPYAKFFLSTITEATALAMSMSALTLYPSPSSSAGPGQFDVILLDPPWQNRSVKRAAKYKIKHDHNPMEVLQIMLGQHIAPNGLVACWITNKPSVRTAALRFFETWDVHLIEEWAWLKVTTNGEPVTEMDGLWRKPYEILLLGRKGNGKLNRGSEEQEEAMKKVEVKRRVIVGVPDLHSRKPNLKALFEDMLPLGYRGLEIFARNLTAEWWAWGDEVLKYVIVQ